MNETRRFLAAGLLGAALSPAATAATPAAKSDRAPASAGPGLLTVNGQLARSNRGPLDPAIGIYGTRLATGPSSNMLREIRCHSLAA